MRRHRERLRQGGSIIKLEVGSGTVADLVALGWLTESNNADKGAIAHALTVLIERAIQTRVSPPTGSHDLLGFMCTIQRSTIETLVSFGWLPADQQNDLGAIAKAFRRLAGRALAVARNGGGPGQWYFP